MLTGSYILYYIQPTKKANWRPKRILKCSLYFTLHSEIDGEREQNDFFFWGGGGERSPKNK